MSGTPTSGSPWADDSTPTEPGPPYAGPPATAPAWYAPDGTPYPQPVPWAPVPQPWAPVPQPWGPVPPRRPQRPGQLITAAVLAFAQAVVVLIASLYVWFIASMADVVAAEAGGGLAAPAEIDALATEGTVLAVVQMLSVVALVAGGLWVLNSRRRGAWRLLAGALAVQVALAVYWAVRLQSEVGGFDTDGAIAAFAMFFAAGPIVGLGMLLVGPARRWFGGTAAAMWQG